MRKHLFDHLLILVCIAAGFSAHILSTEPNMHSGHDHSLPFWEITVALNVEDLYPQQSYYQSSVACALQFFSGIQKGSNKTDMVDMISKMN